MTEHDALRILNVNDGCSQDQMRQAYVDLVKVWHPDRFQSDPRLRVKAELTLQSINEAYTVLLRRTPASEPPPSTARERSAPNDGPRPPIAAPRTVPLHASFRRRVLLAVVIGTAAGVALSLAATLRPLRDDSRVAGDTPVSSERSDITLTADRMPRVTEASLSPPESGSELRSPSQTGTGALSIRNDMPADAVVVLARDVTRDRVFFIRRGQKVTLLDVMPGTYHVRVALGTGWTGSGFAQSAAYYERDEPATIESRQDNGDGKLPTIVIGKRPGLRSVPMFRVE